MRKILHITNTDINIDSRIRKELGAVLAIRGAKISAIGVPEKTTSGVGEIDGAQYIQLRMQSRALSFMPRAIRYFFELIEFTAKAVYHGRRIHADVVHCHDTFALPAGWILKKLHSCKLVYDAHELESNKNGQNLLLSQATLMIERFCWRQVDLLVSVSDSITNWYMQHLGPKPSVLILNAPVLGKQLISNTPGGERQRYFHQRYGIPDDHLIFVYLGILGTGRGIEICLQAFANGPANAHAVFIGFGNLEAKVLDFASRYPNVHFHPAVQHDQVVSLVSSADFGLCLVENASLSDYYCLPNKLFEYCFARIPILASDFPEISRLVNEFSLGVCCDPSSNSVRLALANIVATRPIFTARDITDLSWETQALRLRDVYQRHLFSNLGTI